MKRLYQNYQLKLYHASIPMATWIIAWRSIRVSNSISKVNGHAHIYDS